MLTCFKLKKKMSVKHIDQSIEEELKEISLSQYHDLRLL